jgi:hypothetical protein
MRIERRERFLSFQTVGSAVAVGGEEAGFNSLMYFHRLKLVR